MAKNNIVEVKIQQNIPSGWEAKTFGGIGTLIMGQSPKGSSYSIDEIGLPLLNGAVDLKKDRIEINQYTSAPVRTSKEGDLLFCIRATIGNLQVSDRVYCLGRGVASMRVDEKYDRKFIAQKLEGLFTLMRQRSQGGVIKGLTKDELAGFEVLVPKSKAEQQKIAEILGTVDEDIAKTQEVIEATEKLKRGLMQQLFTRGIGHTKFKETKAGQIPEEWQSKMVKEICDLGRGRVINKTELQENPGQYPVYSSQTSNNGEFGRIATYDFDGEYVTWTTDGEYAGATFYRNGKFNCTNVCGTLKARVPLDMRYLGFVLEIYAEKHVVKTANPKLMNGVMAAVVIPVPTVTEQDKIAEILLSCDEKTSVNKKLKEKLTLLKKGLMQDLLSGTVRTNL